MSKREVKLYLADIVESIGKIEMYSKDSAFIDFGRDVMLIDAIVRNVSIIGEAVKNIPEEMKEKYPAIAWHEIIGMRNKVVHEYFSVDEDILWKTIKEDLPIVKKQIQEILQGM